MYIYIHICMYMYMYIRPKDILENGVPALECSQAFCSYTHTHTHTHRIEWQTCKKVSRLSLSPSLPPSLHHFLSFSLSLSLSRLSLFPHLSLIHTHTHTHTTNTNIRPEDVLENGIPTLLTSLSLTHTHTHTHTHIHIQDQTIFSRMAFRYWNANVV